MNYPGIDYEIPKSALPGSAYFVYGGIKIDLPSTEEALSLLMRANELAQSGQYGLASVIKDGRRMDLLLGPGIPLLIRYPTEPED